MEHLSSFFLFILLVSSKHLLYLYTLKVNKPLYVHYRVYCFPLLHFEMAPHDKDIHLCFAQFFFDGNN